MTLIVRRTDGSDGDRRTMASLRRAWAEEDAGTPIDDAGFEDRAVAWLAANESHRLGWLAEDSHAAVGFATAVVVERMPQPGRPPSGWGYLHHFFVLPELRSRGIGSRLLAAVVAESDHRGWEQLVVHPRPRSLPFYERAGFGVADQLLVRRRGAGSGDVEVPR